MQNSSKENFSTVPIDLKKKLEEIEIRKQIERFEKHLSSFYTQPSYFLVLANLKLQIKDVEGALHYLNEACKLFPKAEFVYDMRAEILYKMKDYNGALMSLNQAIDINPQNDLYYFRRGNVLMQLKIYSSATNDYTKAIEINDLKDDYYFKRGYSRGCLNDLENSIADFEKTLELNPNKTKVNEIIITLNKFSSKKNLG